MSNFLSKLSETLDNYNWMSKNEDALKNLFPDKWTHVSNLEILPLMYRLKLLGIDYRTNEQFIQILLSLEKSNIIVSQGDLIRRNNIKVFIVH